MFALCDIASDGFRRALDSFGCHLQTGQQFDLSASMIEGRFGTNQRQHTAHAGRQVQLRNVQSGIGRELSVMTVRTQIPRALELDLTHGGEHFPRPHFAVTGLLAAGAGDFTLVRAGGIPPQ
jgi:hypothetical protein